MDMTKLATIISLILALSIASERLAEIFKGLLRLFKGMDWLEKENNPPNSKLESWRKTFTQILAVFSGITTSYIASPLLPQGIINPIGEVPGIWHVLALGLLASGGSGLWNTILTYLLELKNSISTREPEALQRMKEKAVADLKQKTTVTEGV